MNNFDLFPPKDLNEFYIQKRDRLRFVVGELVEYLVWYLSIIEGIQVTSYGVNEFAFSSNQSTFSGYFETNLGRIETQVFDRLDHSLFRSIKNIQEYIRLHK